MHEHFGVNTVHEFKKELHEIVLQDIVKYDEPPYRYLWTSLGKTPIRFMRLDKDSRLRGTFGSMNAFSALKALRVQFANKPTHYGSRQYCGTSNCFVPKVPIHGSEEWAQALRCLMLAMDQGTDHWKKGAQLPKTVAIRAPKASTMDTKHSFDWGNTIDARDELELTLRAASMGISPPVYVAFPVKVFSEKLGTIVARDMAYVYEDGWMDLQDLLGNLSTVHQDVAELEAAKGSIGRRVSGLLRTVAIESDFFLMDIKMMNMVGRRRSGTTNKYEVRMIDFGPLLTGEASRHSDEKTSADCIFFVNGLLFLNQLVGHYNKYVPIFKSLAKNVVGVWKYCRDEGDSFCALINKDKERPFQADWLDLDTLLQTESREEHLKLLRAGFYRMLHNYGENGTLLAQVDAAAAASKEEGFINCYVRLLEKHFGLASA